MGWHRGGGQLGQVSWRPPKPKKVPPPADTWKAPVKSGVGGERHQLGVETPSHLAGGPSTLLGMEGARRVFLNEWNKQGVRDRTEPESPWPSLFHSEK